MRAHGGEAGNRDWGPTQGALNTMLRNRFSFIHSAYFEYQEGVYLSCVFGDHPNK